MPLAFHVDVDPQRVRGRGALGDGRRQWDGHLELRREDKCLQETLHILVGPHRPQTRVEVLLVMGNPVARCSS